MRRNNNLLRWANHGRYYLEGEKFWRLTPIAIFSEPGKFIRVLCICDCGKLTLATRSGLHFGKKKSCGCWREEILKDLAVTHGLANRVPEYAIWKNMRTRCSNKAVKSFKDYGGRGIKVCERWNSFASFLADMGRRPSPELTIERVNNDGNYEPNNCKWATRTEQVHNQRPRRRFTRAS